MARHSRLAAGARLIPGMVEVALAAGAVLRKHFGRPIDVREKPGAGLVTNADLEAEALVIRKLKRLDPSFAYLTEETHPEGGLNGGVGRWIVDPLDGTTNFVHRFPMFCVSIAAEWEGQIVAGVIYHPILEDLYTATVGGGAWLRARGGRRATRLRVSRTRRVSDALLATGFSYSHQEVLDEEMRVFGHLSRVARAIRRPGSAALDLAYTARGVFDGFWERKLSPWDVAAGGLIVTEAGGQVSDFAGGPFRPEARQILAAPRAVHAELLKIITAASASAR